MSPKIVYRQKNLPHQCKKCGKFFTGAGYRDHQPCEGVPVPDSTSPADER